MAGERLGKQGVKRRELEVGATPFEAMTVAGRGWQLRDCALEEENR